jgi:indole-3-glycerol phosphate synthase
VLDDIIAGVREDLAVREAATPLAVLKEKAQRQTNALECVSRLSGEDAVAVIAEVKRSSPSKGSLASSTVMTSLLPSSMDPHRAGTPLARVVRAVEAPAQPS